ncbi:TonB-dependent receptor [Sphingomicrobium marinum]|uniref:TonB-dependent receptor n=1 Tax=Sphingomicrobium marinum TaxID=1227950 RepID=UPI0022406236|nr:TonB-dependent receptor [Sphingomicrobium marinum]
MVTGRGLAEDDPSHHEIAIEDTDLAASGRLEDVLGDVAGLAAFRRSDGRSASPTSQGLTLRGLGGNAAARVTLTVDGVPLADPFGGWLNLSSIDLAAIDRIRVTRGGGVDGLAGNVSIDTLDDTDLGAGLFYGSRDSIDAHVRGGANIGQARLLFAGGIQAGDGFIPIVEEDRGLADRPSPYEQYAGRVRFLAPIGGASLQANLSAFQDRRERGFEGSDNVAQGVDASLRMVGDDWSLTAYWQDRQFENAFAALDDTRDNTRPVLDQFDVPSTGLGAAAAYKGSAGPLDWRIGADIRHVEGETNELYFFQGVTPTRQREAGGSSLTAGLYAKTDSTLGAALVEADARFDFWEIGEGGLQETNIDGPQIRDDQFDARSGTDFSGRLGVSAPLGETVTGRAALTRGFRLPTLNELFRPFRIGRDAFAANAMLEPEIANGLEAGIDLSDDALTLSATAFWTRLENPVTNVPLDTGPGLFPGVGFVPGTYSQRRNLDAIESYGVEFDAAYRTGPWQLRASYAFTDATITASGEEAALDGLTPAQTPRHSASATAGWEDDGHAFALTAHYAGERFDEVDNSVKLNDAITFDAVARYPITDRLTLSLRAENIFDAEILADIDGAGTRERARPQTFWIGLVID